MSDPLNSDLPRRVDGYLETALLPADPHLQSALDASERAGLPAIAVSPLMGGFLQVLAQSVGARRILEIGVLGGYSAIWLARALPPEGRLIGLELDADYAALARENLIAAGFGEKAEIRVGPALDSLDRMIEQGEPAFDFVFIDADKSGYPAYFDRVLRLSRAGTVIVADNVVREGRVADTANVDPNLVGIRDFLNQLAGTDALSASALQTVGSKGHDGFALIRVERPLE